MRNGAYLVIRLAMEHMGLLKTAIFLYKLRNKSCFDYKPCGEYRWKYITDGEYYMIMHIRRNQIKNLDYIKSLARKTSTWEILIMSLYIVLVGILVPRHEPWFDEAQAWLLARDLSPFQLFTKYLRYEGTPGLWHLILMIPARLGMPYTTLNIISVLFAAAGVFVFLRYSPFPFFIKVLFPFTFFIFYQYAIVSRSYAMMPLLLFLIAMVYKKRHENIYIFVLLLAILSNANLHGLIIAMSLLGVNLIDVIRRWKTFDKKLRNKHIRAYLAFGIMVGLLILVLWPPEDLYVGNKNYLDFERFIKTSCAVLEDSMVNNIMYQDIHYHEAYLAAAGLLTFVALGCTLLWLGLKRTLLIYVIPVLGLLALFSIKYVNVWHQGIIFLLWIFALWVSIENAGYAKNAGEGLEKWLKRFVHILLAVVMLVHIYWSANSYIYDYFNNYSASREIADYIKANKLQDKKICAVSFHSISILPYFNNNIFDNYNNGEKPSCWLWSTKNMMPKYVSEINSVVRQKPDVIIIGVKFDTIEECSIKIPGYVQVRIFDGNIYWKDAVYEKDAFILYLRSP